jgi:copper(I)-binding protein
MRPIAYLTVALAFAQLAGGAIAQDSRASGIQIMHPWARATTTDATAVYFTIVNTAAKPDRLLKATTDIGRTSIHEMKEEGGIAKMRSLDSLAIPAKTEVSIQPGGFHLMLTNLRQPLAEGSGFPMTLVFETAGEVHIDVQVRKAGSKPMTH